MATLTNTFERAEQANPVVAFFANLKDAMVKRRVYRQTVKELSALSDRDLCDLGISRGEIHYVAHAGAYQR